MPEETPSPSPAESPEPRRLLRSRDERVLGGVCGGLARYFAIDPLIVRIAAVAFLFVGGVSAIAYVAALLLVPEDDETGQPAPRRAGRVSTLLGAAVLVLAGVAVLDGGLGWGAGWAFGALVPTVIVVVVLAVAGQRLLAERGADQPTAARIAGAALLVSGVGLGVVALALGGAVATAAGGGTVVAGVIIALGLAMAALSFRDGQIRRARWLVLPAFALAVPASVVAAAGVDVGHGVGSRNYAPATVADLRPGGYELGVGELEVDLREMTWPSTAPVRLKVDVGTGHALVLVPEDVCVQSDAHAGLGYVGVLGQENGGADIDEQSGTVARTSGRRLVLDADMGIGAIEVRHSRDRSWRDGHEVRDARGADAIADALADAGCAGERA